MTELLDRLEHRLKLAERHGPIVAGREVYIRATDLREVLQALRDGEKMRAALEEIAEHFERSPGNSEPAHMAKTARSALTGEGQ